MKSFVRIQRPILSLFLIFCLAGWETSSFAKTVRLEEGTQVRLKLMEFISSETAKAGQIINFEVVEEVKVGDTVVIAQGAPAVGTIIEAQPKRRIGREGKLAFRLDHVKTVDGSKVPLRATSISKGGGRVATVVVTTALVAAFASVAAAPLFLLIKGKEIGLPKGQHIDAFVDGSKLVEIKERTGETSAEAASANELLVSPNNHYPASGTRPASSEPCSVNIISEPDGAEIEVDGAFYGNTPAMLRLPAALHTITLRSANSEPWVRTVNLVPGSSITLRAEMQKGLRRRASYRR